MIYSAADPARRWTPDQVTDYLGIGGIGPVVVGSTATVADEPERSVEEIDVDGFVCATTPGTFDGHSPGGSPRGRHDDPAVRHRELAIRERESAGAYEYPQFSYRITRESLTVVEEESEDDEADASLRTAALPRRLAGHRVVLDLLEEDAMTTALTCSRSRTKRVRI